MNTASSRRLFHNTLSFRAFVRFLQVHSVFDRVQVAITLDVPFGTVSEWFAVLEANGYLVQLPDQATAYSRRGISQNIEIRNHKDQRRKRLNYANGQRDTVTSVCYAKSSAWLKYLTLWADFLVPPGATDTGMITASVFTKAQITRLSPPKITAKHLPPKLPVQPTSTMFNDPILRVLRQQTGGPGQTVKLDNRLFCMIAREAGIDVNNLAQHGTPEDGWFWKGVHPYSITRKITFAYLQMSKRSVPLTLKNTHATVGQWGLTEAGFAVAEADPVWPFQGLSDRRSNLSI